MRHRDIVHKLLIILTSLLVFAVPEYIRFDILKLFSIPIYTRMKSADRDKNGKVYTTRDANMLNARINTIKNIINRYKELQVLAVKLKPLGRIHWLYGIISGIRYTGNVRKFIARFSDTPEGISLMHHG